MLTDILCDDILDLIKNVKFNVIHVKETFILIFF